MNAYDFDFDKEPAFAMNPHSREYEIEWWLRERENTSDSESDRWMTDDDVQELLTIDGGELMPQDITKLSYLDIAIEECEFFS